MYCKYTWDDYDNTTAIVYYNGSKNVFDGFLFVLVVNSL